MLEFCAIRMSGNTESILCKGFPIQRPFYDFKSTMLQDKDSCILISYKINCSVFEHINLCLMAFKCDTKYKTSPKIKNHLRVIILCSVDSELFNFLSFCYDTVLLKYYYNFFHHVLLLVYSQMQS